MLVQPHELVEEAEEGELSSPAASVGVGVGAGIGASSLPSRRVKASVLLHGLLLCFRTVPSYQF